MGPDPIALQLADLQAHYAPITVPKKFTRLYSDDEEFGKAFASLHERLNDHFELINDRANTTRHYWASKSREFLALMKELARVLGALRRAGFEVIFSDAYDQALDRCKGWLSSSGGSTVPETFQEIAVIEYDPVFIRPALQVRLAERRPTIKLVMIGSGSYANVYSFVDPEYDIKFALKRAKKGLTERDVARFRAEFKILKGIRYPYIVEVYKYDEGRDEYRLEFCDKTLRAYIKENNQSLRFATRKRIALQFLYGIDHLHRRGILHRDLSLQNILVKMYDGNAVILKLSDFGLAKEVDSQFTRTATAARGTILDPTLDNFKAYGVVNEMYSIGVVLSYILTGRERIATEGALARITWRCTENDTVKRYQNVGDVISDVERLRGL